VGLSHERGSLDISVKLKSGLILGGVLALRFSLGLNLSFYFRLCLGLLLSLSVILDHRFWTLNLSNLGSFTFFDFDARLQIKMFLLQSYKTLNLVLIQ